MGRTSDAKERLIQAAMDLFFYAQLYRCGRTRIVQSCRGEKGEFLPLL